MEIPVIDKRTVRHGVNVGSIYTKSASRKRYVGYTVSKLRKTRYPVDSPVDSTVDSTIEKSISQTVPKTIKRKNVSGQWATSFKDQMTTEWVQKVPKFKETAEILRLKNEINRLNKSLDLQSKVAEKSSVVSKKSPVVSEKSGKTQFMTKNDLTEFMEVKWEDM